MAKASTLKAKAWTFESKATGPEVLKHTARAEIKITSTSKSDEINKELNFDCFCLDIHCESNSCSA